MNGWVFFPQDRNKKLSNDDAAALLLELLNDSGRLSQDDWNTYVPETREPLQGRSLGFFCGGAGLSALKNTPAAQDLPDFPMPIFVSDFSIMPECWSYKEALIVPAAPDLKYRVFLKPEFRKVVTVTSPLPDRPPCFAVYGSYCFFPPPYVVKDHPKN